MRTSKQVEITDKVLAYLFSMLEELVDREADAQYALLAEAILKFQQVKRGINSDPRGM